MLIKNRLEHSGSEQKGADDSWRLHDIAASSIKVPSTLAGSADRYTVHIVAGEAQQRAAMARLIFAAGHHAEVYNSAEELVEHHPAGGIVFVHEAGCLGATVVCNALAENALWLPVLAFGEQIEPSRIVAGIKAGALDYLVGALSTETILTKLASCAKEAEAIAEVRARQAAAQSLIRRLSDRERQVLELLANGLSNKEMARSLEISPRTVEIHRMKMMGKIGANSSAHAVRIRIDALAA